MAVPRFIVVDDADPSIQYNGESWFSDVTGSQNSLGNLGPAYQNTLHGTNSDASFSFNFSGSQFIVFGTNNPVNNDPTWECFIDGVSTGTNAAFQFPENSWKFCNAEVEDAPHVLTVNATVRSQTFWFDQIRYVPSASVPLDNKAILIDNLDPIFQNSYSPGWVPLGVNANMTAQTNSSFSFEFTGESVMWFGRFLATNLSQPVIGSASYSIDKSTPQNFFLQGLVANAAEDFNEKLFQTPNLTQGNHQVSVLFEGNATTTPLTFDYLIVQNGSTSLVTSTPTTTTASAGTVSGSSAINSATNTSTNLNEQASKKSPVGIIVGSIIGALALIALVIIGAIYMRRRSRQKEIDISPTLEPSPFIHSPSTNTTGQHTVTRLSAVDPTVQSPSFVYSPLPNTESYRDRQFTDSQPLPASQQSSSSTSGKARQYILSPISLDSTTATTLSDPFNRPTPEPPVPEQQRRPSKAAGGHQQSEPVRRQDNEMIQSPSSTVSTPFRVLMHEDSGIRLNSDPSERVIEMPPQYTPS